MGDGKGPCIRVSLGLLYLYLSLLIRKDTKSYPVMTCAPGQDSDAGKLKE